MITLRPPRMTSAYIVNLRKGDGNNVSVHIPRNGCDAPEHAASVALKRHPGATVIDVRSRTLTIYEVESP